MARYGAKSPKPHKAWSNDPALLRARAGHLSKSAMAALKETQERALVVVGTKSNGKRTYSGSSALKESQPLDHQMFHGHTHVLVLSHAHGMHACLSKPYPGPRYYPPAFGDHFVQIAMDLDVPADGQREKKTLSPQDALLTDISSTSAERPVLLVALGHKLGRTAG